VTDGERRAYQRGYARNHRWPEHRPPTPPDPLVRDLMEAATFLRDTVDNFCALLEPEDEWVEKLGPGIDRLDEAMTRLGLWLVEKDD